MSVSTGAGSPVISIDAVYGTLVLIDARSLSTVTASAPHAVTNSGLSLNVTNGTLSDHSLFIEALAMTSRIFSTKLSR